MNSNHVNANNASTQGHGEGQQVLRHGNYNQNSPPFGMHGQAHMGPYQFTGNTGQANYMGQGLPPFPPNQYPWYPPYMYPPPANQGHLPAQMAQANQGQQVLPQNNDANTKDLFVSAFRLVFVDDLHGNQTMAGLSSSTKSIKG